MRLALKAQAQCRATIETLAVLKNPPVVYARHADVAGQQQVNNTPLEVSPRPRKKLKIRQTNYWSAGEPSQRLDARTSGATPRSNSPVEALGAVYRAKDGRRQATGQPQRRSWRTAPEAPR